MQSDDLTNLFAPANQADPWRQGTVVAFDVATGANTIDVAGSLLADLPLLNIGDTVNLVPGDAVVLAKFGGSWAIIGRVVPSGSPDLHRANTEVRIVSGGSNPSGYFLSTSPFPKASALLVVPAWANRARVLVSGSATARNSSGATDFLNVGFQVNGVGGDTMYSASVPTLLFGHVALSQVIDTGPITPGGSFTVEMDLWTTVGTWGVNASNVCRLSILAAFYRA